MKIIQTIKRFIYSPFKPAWDILLENAEALRVSARKLPSEEHKINCEKHYQEVLKGYTSRYGAPLQTKGLN